MKERIQKLVRYREIKRIIERHEKLLMPGMLILGVAVDFFTFKNIKISSAFLILLGHYILLGIAIALSHIKSQKRILKYLNLLSLLAIQFSLGALLSASLIFYWFSGAFSVSWPILGLIAIAMLSNEVFRNHFRRPTVQISAYYFVSFSFLTLVLPFLFNSISFWFFILAGILSLIIIHKYVQFLSKRIPIVEMCKKNIKISVITIFIAMNTLYAFNIIPPIPLSLKEAGVYHLVERTTKGYRLEEEKESFIDRVIPGKTIHTKTNDSIYVFSSIFAPTNLNTRIYHQWEFYDKGKWIEKDRLSFMISGGRDEGYRGFSLKSGLRQGKWRVSIETKRGQVLGKVKFKVKKQIKEPLIKEIRR